MRKQFLFLLILVYLFSGCRKNPVLLEEVLAYSGANRPELEKVIAHYARNPEDSLKLRAAVFLIENMPGHYAMEGQVLEDYWAKLDTTPGVHYHVKKMMQTVPYHYPNYRKRMQVCEDVKSIRADYLISRIDQAFAQWKDRPWLKEIDYETFRDYLLPYRVENEPLDYWRDSVGIFRKRLDECLEWYDNSWWNMQKLAGFFFSFNNNLARPVIDSAFRDYSYDCVTTSMTELFAMRIIGIPAAIDFTPGFANHNGRHYWMMPIDNRINNADCIQLKLNTAAKVYRRTFAHQAIPDYTSKEYIPPFFLEPFNKDVTDLYLQTSEVDLELPKRPSGRYACLAIFNDLKWLPVAWTTVRGKRVVFQNMGKQVVYLPVGYSQEEEMLPLAPPFVLYQDGSVHDLEIIKDSVQTMTLKRKYTSRSQSESWTNGLLGARFEWSDTIAFTTSDTVGIIEQQPGNHYSHITIKNTMPERYWRFVPSIRNCQLAELVFRDAEGRVLTGRLIGPDVVRGEKLFDNDPLTYTYIDQWIGIDFGVPQAVSEIFYLPRNDANGIFPGDRYELFYYRFPEGWISAGKQTASDHTLVFHRVPAGTLYWLRNKTTGIEERIFTWEGGEARFW